jgi:hypothetical protein
MASYLTPGDDPTAGAAPALNPIAVTDIVALGVPVDWPEAVAVVAELCTVLQAAESATWVPEPEDVLITAHGTVIIRRGGGGTHDVDELGRMLHSLLDPSRTPMPIRLFLTQSIGFNRYTTVQAYAEALAYYERPGRAELVQSLYHRCLETPPEALTPRTPVEEAVVDAEPPRPMRRHGLAVAVALVCGLAAAAAVWVWQAGVPVGVSVAAFKDAVTAAASAAVEQVGWEAAPTSGELVEREEPGRAAPRRTRTVAQVPRRTPATADPIADVSSLRPQLIAPPAIALDPVPAVEGGFALAPAGPAAAPPAPAMVADSTVYSEGSEGVEPPVMYFPQLPPVVPAGEDPRRLNTMELLVDERGAVQAAKLTSRPVRLPDMTLLSAAKTWRFHPATKDGRPVKYRLSLSWSVTPP